MVLAYLKEEEAQMLLEMVITHYELEDKQDWDNFGYVIRLVDVAKALFKDMPVALRERVNIPPSTKEALLENWHGDENDKPAE